MAGDNGRPRRAIEGVVYAKTAYSDIDDIGPWLHSHLYSHDRSLGHALAKDIVGTFRSGRSQGSHSLKTWGILRRSQL